MEHYLVLESRFCLPWNEGQELVGKNVIPIPSCCKTPLWHEKDFCAYRLSPRPWYIASTKSVIFFNTNGAVTFSLLEILPSYLSDFGDLLWSRQQKEHSPNLRCRCAHAIRAVWCLWFRTNPFLRRLARRLDVFRLLPKVSWGWFVVILDGHWYHSLVLTLR